MAAGPTGDVTGTRASEYFRYVSGEEFFQVGDLREAEAEMMLKRRISRKVLLFFLLFWFRLFMAVPGPVYGAREMYVIVCCCERRVQCRRAVCEVLFDVRT